MNAGELILCLDVGPTLVLDRQTGERRRSTHDERFEATRSCDALEEVGMWWDPVEGKLLGDTAAPWVSSMAETLRNSSRHVRAAAPGEFRRFLNLIDERVPAGLDVHLIVGKPSTHEAPAIQRWLIHRPRFAFHFTPTYG